MFFSSIAGLLLSSFYLIPSLIQLSSSPRLNLSSHDNYFTILNQVVCANQQNKNFMLYGAEFIISLIIVLVIKKKIKIYISNLLMILFLVFPIFFENIDIFWHAGPYQMFPMRFGYMLTFESLHLLLISEKDISIKSDSKIFKILGLLGISCLPMIPFVLRFFVKYFQTFGIRDDQIYLTYWIIITLLSLTYFCVFMSHNKIIILSSFVFLSISQAILGFWGFIGADVKYSPECEDDIVLNSKNVLKEISDNNFDYRTKDVNNYLNSNYAFITRSESGAGWVNGFTSEYYEERFRLGYVRDYTRSLDAGGTAFSDYLLGYNTAIINSGYKDIFINDLLYSNINDNKYVFKINNSKYGFYSKNYINNVYIDPIDYQNSIYHSIINDQEDLFIRLDLTSNDYTVNKEGGIEISKKIEIGGRGVLYLYSFNYEDENDNYFSIFVNDKPIYAPFLYYENNNQFPIDYRNGFLDLGSYDYEKINIKINGLNDRIDNLILCYMDYDKFLSFCDYMDNAFNIENYRKRNNRIKFEVYSRDDGILTLPIGYSGNWIIKKNGKIIKTNSNLNNSFLALDIDEGLNDFTIIFIQKGFVIGLIISLFGICSLVFYNKVVKIFKDKISTILFIIYKIVLYGVLIAFYGIPIIYTIVIMVLNKITPYDIIFYVM